VKFDALSEKNKTLESQVKNLELCEKIRKKMHERKNAQLDAQIAETIVSVEELSIIEAIKFIKSGDEREEQNAGKSIRKGGIARKNTGEGTRNLNKKFQ
jgi:hypothetical protein